MSVTILDANNTVVDRGVTNELGEILLDTPIRSGDIIIGPPVETGRDAHGLTNQHAQFLRDTPGLTAGIAPPDPTVNDGGQTYSILVDGYPASQPFISPSVDVVASGRDTITGLLFVSDLNDVIALPSTAPSASGSSPVVAIPSLGASAVASASASASASAAPSMDGDVVEDGVTVSVLVSERFPDRAGTFRYFIDLVETTDEGDLRYAVEGEYEIQVLTVICAARSHPGGASRFSWRPDVPEPDLCILVD